MENENGPFSLVTLTDEGFGVETLFCKRHYAERRFTARTTQHPSPSAVYLYGAEVGGLINSYHKPD